MAQIKTRETSASVREFLSAVKNETRRKDGLVVVNKLEDVDPGVLEELFVKASAPARSKTES